MAIDKIRFQMRQGTAAEATAANDVLIIGEWGYETDTDKLKIGDGATAWNSLPYFAASGLPNGGTIGQVLAKLSSTDGDAGWADAGSGGPQGIVTYLFSMNGTNGSTTFANSAGYGDGTASGGAAISTAQGKFGGSSLKIGSAVNSQVTLAASALFCPQADVCMELWFYLDSAVNPTSQDVRGLISNRNSADSTTTDAFGLRLLPVSGNWRLAWFGNDGLGNNAVSLTGSTNVSQNAWHHMAFIKRGGIVRFFLDGVAQGTAPYSFNVHGRPLSIGAEYQSPSATTRSLQGYIGGLRITTGWYRYWDDFTPPATAFTL